MDGSEWAVGEGAPESEQERGVDATKPEDWLPPELKAPDKATPSQREGPPTTALPPAADLADQLEDTSHVEGLVPADGTDLADTGRGDESADWLPPAEESVSRDEFEKRLDPAREEKLRRERDEAVTQLRSLEQRLEEAQARAETMEKLADEIATKYERDLVHGAVTPQSADHEAKAEIETALPASTSGSGKVNLNAATFEQLRGLGMSKTQANRVLSYREKSDGYQSLDDLDEVPGFPRAFLAALKTRLDV